MTEKQHETKAKNRKKRIGTVVSIKMNKTAVVSVARSFIHPVYKAIVRTNKKYYAHDEENQCKIGDLVKIEETRPLSKMKRWRIREIIERAQ